MGDTSTEINQLYRKMLMNRSGQERMMMGFSMFDSSLKMIEASFPKQITQKQKKVLLLKRLYKNDFTDEEFNKIVTYFER